MAAQTQENEFDLLQPEIIPKEDLIKLITERCPNLGDINNFDKPKLVEVFYENVAALPQRKYRLNRRGRQMTTKQIMIDKRKRKFSDVSGDAEKQMNQNGSRTISSCSVQASGDRLRPPPSAVNFDRKVIQLGKGSASSSTNRVSLSNSTKTMIRVINSKNISLNSNSSSGEQNGDSDSKMDTTESESPKKKLCVDHGLASKPEVVKIMPNKVQSPPSKIKLKRPSGALAPHLSPTGNLVNSFSSSSIIADRSPDATSVPHVHEDVKIQHASEKKDSVMETSSKRQLNLIQKTLTGNSSIVHPEKAPDKNPEETSEEHKTLRTKFQRVSVTWP